MFLKAISLAFLLATATASRPHRGYVVPLFDTRLNGGSETQLTEFPWLVSLQWGWLFGYSHFCSGSIINNQWIVTAGYCALSVPEYGDLIVKAGKNNLKLVENSEQTVHVEKIIVHERYNGDVSSNDIALLKLSKPLSLTAYVKPIEFMKSSAVVCTNATLAGWGSTSRTSNLVLLDRLQKAVLPIIDIPTCRKYVESLVGTSPLDTNNICTGPLSGGFSPYNGDTGSPLVFMNGTTPQLLGLVSWGIFPTGIAGTPMIYTRVFNYADWIRGVIAKN
ncbi:trypsin-like [Xylocopa sonorina]|uniref:trypsin-like n=1 Tax=Xylocopa sonorina TaxID=1818115 RepID=UPI00403B3586